MINRAAVILKYKKPFIDWINNSDPIKNTCITIDKANEDRTVYLINEDEADDFEKWISHNYSQLFESELEDWFTVQSLWLKKRTRTLFDKWFSIQCHSILIDTVGGSIYDDEI
jgi:hypothetical protein